MKLHELAAPKSSKHLNRVFESYFSQRIKLERLSPRHTQRLLARTQQLLREHNHTSNQYGSEKNPNFLKLLMLEQILTVRMAEQNIPTQITPDPKNPKLVAALKKSQSGQTLTPEEQKLVSDLAVAKQAPNGTTNPTMSTTLKESEVQQAQVVLAAQDMVDQMQSMLEDTTEMQFKELPALVDSIRNQIGMEQAMQFQTDATAALTGLVQNLQGAKQQLEQALNVVTGQAQPTPALDAAMGAAPTPADDELAGDLDTDADLDADLSLDANVPDEEEEPAGTRGALGRSRR